jgi:manganese/zinc/iron transport system permease protein
MLSDALSHAVLPGVIVGAWAAGTTASPLLLLGATVSGVLVIALTEWIRSRGRVTADSATGLVFPVFFAVGIILLSTVMKESPINESTVLVGDLNIAAMKRLIIGGFDVGPVDAWVVGSVGLVTALAIWLFRRPLTVSSFDPVFGQSIGLRERVVHYVIMTLVALTVVAAFNAAGAVLLVALMIVPAATATMFTKTLGGLCGFTVIFALLSSQIGFWIAYHLNTATSPTMAFVGGVLFLMGYGVHMARRTLQRT